MAKEASKTHRQESPGYRLTRRKLAGAILSSAAATALAQTQPAAPGTPDEELKAARDRIHATSETLAKQSVPIEAEPALEFKA